MQFDSDEEEKSESNDDSRRLLEGFDEGNL